MRISLFSALRVLDLLPEQNTEGHHYFLHMILVLIFFLKAQEVLKNCTPHPACSGPHGILTFEDSSSPLIT